MGTTYRLAARYCTASAVSVMAQPASSAVTTRRDVYLLCPDLASFRATHPRPLQGVWHTVNNDFGSFKRKQMQLLKNKRKGDEADVTVTDEEAYVHTRQLALRRYDANTHTASSAGSASASSLLGSPASSSSASAASAVLAVSAASAASAVLAMSAEMPSHSAIREAFGDDCFPWAYWASQDSMAEHRLTGYYLTDRQWLNRVVKLIETLGTGASSTAGTSAHATTVHSTIVTS